jgi:hypothetical protein
VFYSTFMCFILSGLRPRRPWRRAIWLMGFAVTVGLAAARDPGCELPPIAQSFMSYFALFLPTSSSAAGMTPRQRSVPSSKRLVMLADG